MPQNRLHRIVLLLALLLAPATALNAQLPPNERWRTFDTPHFRIHYSEGLEPLARRAADRAERAYTEVAALLVRPPRGRIDLLVSDNVDYTNGYATPLPTNRVVIYANPPVSEPTLSYYEDWLELVITHELVHIFHLDYAGGIWKPLRAVFGRSPFLFPSAITAGWVVEGLATYAESELTGAGRVRGTMHDMVLRTAILEDAFFSIDRASGDPARWPGGSTRYVYGSLFIAHLSERYGSKKVGEFIRVAGGSLVPYRLDAAARKAFGVSFTRAWREWEETLRARYLPLADSLRAAGLTEPEQLTEEGRFTGFPRYSPDGTTLAFSTATGRDEPSTRLLRADGTERELVPRTTLGPASWLPGGEGLLLSQLDYRDPYHVFARVHRVGLDGDLDRLPGAERVLEVHPHPDGRRAVGVRTAGGSNVPVVLDLATGAARPLAGPSLDVHWSLPRWSPRGDRIAVGRWRVGGYYDVVVLDSAGRVQRELTRDRAVDDAPAWSPDGRYVLFASNRTGINNLYAYDLREERLLQVTNVLTGAFQPDVSPDGRWIAFAHHRSDGFHVARIPYDPTRWRPAPPVHPRFAPGETRDYTATAGGPDRPYSPWRSLRPAGWTPVVYGEEGLGTGVGAVVAGTDVVGRHLYGALALVYPEEGEVDASLGYQYSGLGVPVLDVEAFQEWSVLARAGEVTDTAGRKIPSAVLERERSLGAALTFPRPRFRSYTWLTVGGEIADRARVWDDPEVATGRRLRDPPPDLGGVLTAGYSSVRAFGFSISPEQGFAASLSAEGHRYLRPWAGEERATGYTRLVGRSRAYRGFEVAGFARHVVAARLAAGAESGTRGPGFRLGGTGGAPSPAPFGLGSEFARSLTFPVRGYPEGAQRGDRAVSASAEYRFPLALVERGYRLLPVFLDRLWGDVFADAGTAWCEGACPLLTSPPTAPRPLVSVGGELGVELTTGYFIGATLRGGVAVPLRAVPAAGGRRPEPEVYLRFGRSF